MKVFFAEPNRALDVLQRPGFACFPSAFHERPALCKTTETQKLHRIEEKALVEEVKKAGFKLESSADFLRNKADSRETNVFDEKIRGKTDRFVLKFVKP